MLGGMPERPVRKAVCREGMIVHRLARVVRKSSGIRRGTVGARADLPLALAGTAGARRIFWATMAGYDLGDGSCLPAASAP
jgi:hypothetical protein